MPEEQVAISLFDPVLFPVHVAVLFVFGSLFGSFFNVVIWRAPRRFSVVVPGSHCTACGSPIRWYDNIPILSWLLLGRRCRRCGSPISARYAAVELLTALLFVAVFWQFRHSGATVVYLVFVSLLVIATFTDIDHWIIPDFVNFGGLAFALAVALLGPWLGEAYPLMGPWQPFEGDWWQGFAAALLGAAVGYGILQGIAVIGRILFRKEAMGQGDVWLVAMFGAFMGWQGAIGSLVLACFLGAFIGGALMLLDKIRETLRGGPLPDPPEDLPEGLDPSTPGGFSEAVAHFDLHRKERRVSSHLPFGPYLCLAALITLFLWEDLVSTLHAIYVAPFGAGGVPPG